MNERMILYPAEIARYLELVEERPELFVQSSYLPLVLEGDEIVRFASCSGKRVGVVYESGYSIMLVDVVADDGELFAYERVVPASSGASVVLIPECNGNVVLLDQFRHPIRNMQYGFPRGFGENGLSPEQNARKELFEELGAVASSVELLGVVSADSGLAANMTSVLRCRIEQYKAVATEGIAKTIELGWDELGRWISQGRITDGFTLSAYALCMARCDDGCR